MVNRVQTLRSSAPGVLPQAGTRQPGELWLNFADFALGFIDASQTAQKILAVRWFVPTASYAVGDFVLNGGNLYRAIAPSSAGTFVAANWSKVGTAADLTAMQAYVDAADALRVPLAGGTMTGPLILNADPTAALGATTKQYVDLHSGAVTVSATPPANPNPGALWWDSVGGQLYVWYVDPSTSQWVIAVTSAGTLPVASTTTLGAVKVDGTSIQAAGDGTISTIVVPMGDNRLVNGDMRIDQRNNGAAGTAINAYTIDRWRFAASQPSKGQWIRGTGPAPAGFPYCLNFGSSSAYTALASDVFAFYQPIEADMVSDFAWGTTNVQPVTLSFWASSNVVGTFSGAIQNAAETRSYPFSFTLPTANIFTKIVVNIPGDTAGTWVMSGNAASIFVIFDLGSGSNFRTSAGAWVAGNYWGVIGAQSIISANGAAFNLTGVKLEIGSVATPFNRQSLAKSLVDCQRYYEISNGDIFQANVTSGSNYYNASRFSVAKRAAPTMAFVDQGSQNFPSGVPTLTSAYADMFFAQKPANTTGVGFYQYGWTASAEL